VSPDACTRGHVTSENHEWTFVGVQAAPDDPAHTRAAPMVLAVWSRCGLLRVDLSGERPVPRVSAVEEEQPFLR
jgi:hypothetical protein